MIRDERVPEPRQILAQVFHLRREELRVEQFREDDLRSVQPRHAIRPAPPGGAQATTVAAIALAALLLRAALVRTNDPGTIRPDRVVPTNALPVLANARRGAIGAVQNLIKRIEPLARNALLVVNGQVARFRFY